jgi:hypothetical protein
MDGAIIGAVGRENVEVDTSPESNGSEGCLGREWVACIG